MEEEADVGEETKRVSQLNHSQTNPQAPHRRQLPLESEAGVFCWKIKPDKEAVYSGSLPISDLVTSGVRVFAV